MRLIDADEMAVQESEAYMKVNAREDVNPITQGINSVVHRKIQELIANTPTIDATPVVRCKECLYRSQYADKNGLYKCGAIQCEEGHCIKVAPLFACIAGKRRDGEG